MQELKQKNDIAEVIGSYVALDKKGGNYWACCPFHHEKTPSFAVNESEQFYHCFGCGASGDVVKFVQEIESTDFMGAVRILAARAKIPVPESNFDSEKAALLKKKRDALVEILLASARFYLSNLYGGKADAHLEYISRREARADDGQEIRPRRVGRFLFPARISLGQGLFEGEPARQRRADRSRKTADLSIRRADG